MEEAQRPKGLNYKGKAKRVFQQQALHFMIQREKSAEFLGGAQCCPIGTGKTFVSIMNCATNLLDSEESTRLFKLQNSPKCFSAVNLVVCPDVVKNHWKSEIRAVWPSQRVFYFSRVGKIGQFVRDGTPYSITDLHANSFVLISWECLAKEIHYANACEAGTHVFSLAWRFWGRVIFDEGQFSGSANCLKFKMCNKLQSLYRWYQSASPKDLQDVAQFLGASSTQGIIWQPSVEDIKSQMSLPSVMSKNVPISFSLVESEYYKNAKMNDTEKQNFCKINPYSPITLKVYVVEMLRHEISQLKETQVQGLYELALHQYFVLKEQKLAIATLQKALQIATDKSQYLLTNDEPIWKKHIAKFITTMIFFGDSRSDLIQLQADNIQDYVAIDPKCIRITTAQKATEWLHSEFKKTRKSKSIDDMMELWMCFVVIDMTQDIGKLDQVWIKEHKTIYQEYDNIHKQLDEINNETKITCHLNSDYFTLYQKFSIVLANVHKRLMMSQYRRKLHVLFEFCLMTNYEKSGNISIAMKTNANKCYKDNLDTQFKAWKEFSKIGKENPLVKNNLKHVSNQNCFSEFRTLLQNQKVLDEDAKCVKMIIALQKNFILLDDVSALNVIQAEDVETIKSLNQYDCKKPMVVDDDIDAVLQQKIKHFDLVVPQLLVKCPGCALDFGRSNIPIHFGCGHVMCDKCEEKRVENLNDGCGRCYSVKLQTCPVCNIVSSREVHNQTPNGITVSDLYPVITSIENGRKLVKECNIHNIGGKAIERSKSVNGCKIPKIVELILNLIQHPQLQADGTNCLGVDHRKMLVFDSDPKFLRALAMHFISSDKDKISVYLLEENHKIIDQFTSCQGSAVFFLDVIHTAGLHLAEADTVILCTPSKDPSVEMQAIGRAHRFGQKRPVSVYHCYIENSIEDKVVEFDQDDEDCVGGEKTPPNVELKILQDDYYSDEVMEAKPREVIEIHDDEKVTEKVIVGKNEMEKPAAVKVMLQELQLEEHWQAFQTEKYEWLEDLSELSHLDLDRLQVPRGRRGRIFNFLDNHNVKRQKRE